MTADGERPFAIVFRHSMGPAEIVGVRLPHPAPEVLPSELQARLHPMEWGHAQTLKPLRRVTWIGGRLALRAALAHVGVDEVGALLSDDRGAPVLPARLVGSVSHKSTLAVGLVAADEGVRIGVDVEDLWSPPRTQIARRVLTPEELARWSRLPEEEQWPQLLLWFSAKEALYKALDPYVRRYVGFTEVALHTYAPQQLEATLLSADLRGFTATGEWAHVQGHLLTTFTVRRGG